MTGNGLFSASKCHFRLNIAQNVSLRVTGGGKAAKGGGGECCINITHGTGQLPRTADISS
jgi:hypothetical protein